MTLVESIDAENQDVFSEVLNVTYPLTIKNILKNECSVRIKISPDENNNLFNFNFESDVYKLHEGNYTLDSLLYSINLFLDEYDCKLMMTHFGKIILSINTNLSFWYSIKSANDSSVYNTTTTPDGKKWDVFQKLKTITNLNVKTEITFSKKLSGMLGFEQQTMMHEKSDSSSTYIADYLPDISYGINKLYIYCDQIDLTLIGDSKSEILCVVPVEVEKMGSGELASYQPHTTKKKISKSIIRELHIYLTDATGAYIQFDNGTVNIDCKITSVKNA